LLLAGLLLLFGLVFAGLFIIFSSLLLLLLLSLAGRGWDSSCDSAWRQGLLLLPLRAGPFLRTGFSCWGASCITSASSVPLAVFSVTGLRGRAFFFLGVVFDFAGLYRLAVKDLVDETLFVKLFSACNVQAAQQYPATQAKACHLTAKCRT
jgi:hypothetical protein